jgi:hypothetical protein
VVGKFGTLEECIEQEKRASPHHSVLSGMSGENEEISTEACIHGRGSSVTGGGARLSKYRGSL